MGGWIESFVVAAALYMRYVPTIHMAQLLIFFSLFLYFSPPTQAARFLVSPHRTILTHSILGAATTGE